MNLAAGAPMDSVCRLAPMQQGMLFNALYTREPGMDVVQVVGDLREDVDGAAFRRAWQRAIDRHTILRTAFRWDGAELVQQVHPEVQTPFESRDPGWLDDAARERWLHELLTADRRRGFELGRPPLLRVGLHRTGPERMHVLLTFHHAILDGRSLLRLLREVFAWYEAPSHTEPPAIPYHRYVAWLERQDRSGDEPFWRGLLRGFRSPTPLFADRAFGPEAPGTGAHAEQDLELGAELSSALRGLAAAHGLTLNTLVQAAWALLLARHSDRRDVVFGATRSVRRDSVDGADGMIGLFLNTLPVRVPVEPRERLLPWLRALREQAVAVREHRDTPLHQLQRWSDVPSGGRLFDSILLFENFLLSEELRRLGRGWTGRRFSLRRQVSYPIALTVFAEPDVLIKVMYDERRFPAAAMVRIAGQLRTVLTAMVQDPDRRLGELPLSGEEERRRLAGWNATARARPRGVGLHDLVARRAAEAPGDPAVRDGETVLAYGELMARSAGLAAELRSLGVGPEVRVAICARRGAGRVAAELAILLAGGACVPLAPDWPVERLRSVVRDASARVLLSDRGGLDVEGARVVPLDGWPWRAAPRGAGRWSPAMPANLAYVISTSGSTGAPKGVACTHDGMVNAVTWFGSAYSLRPGDHLAHLAHLAFDVSVLEVWAALAAGATLHLADEEARRSPDRLLAWLRERRITVASLPTGLAELALPLAWSPGPLRAVFVAGDRLHHVAAVGLPFEVHNGYGPTECSVITTAGRVATGPDGDPQPSIGRPIANVRAHLLDGDLVPVPGGVAGELCVAGDGLARGYLGRPGPTAERFLPDPVGPEPGGRIYRTGDLARHRADGSLEFLGRLDRQVKVRGFRIEPGEVEAAIAAHPGVAAVVVTATDGASSERRLVAHVVPAGGAAPDTGELRAFLRQRLPDHMVPSSFVPLERLPLTPNGKVDRRALPAPGPPAPGRAMPAPPATALQERLLGIVGEVLGVAVAGDGGPAGIGVEDDFFELGGHSLLAVHAVMRVNAALGMDLPVRSLFEAPTVAALSVLIEGRAGESGGPARRPIPRLDRSRHLVRGAG